MKLIYNIWNSPMKDSCDLSRSARILLLVSLFVTLFLWYFQPFGINEYRGNIFLLSCGFGMVTFIAGMIVEVFEVKVLQLRKDHPSWKFKNWLISAFTVVIAIAIGNFIFMSILSDGHSVSLRTFFFFVVNTAAIGIFPLTIAGILTFRSSYQSNSRIADTINIHKLEKEETPVTIPNNHGPNLTIPSGDILCLEAKQNYVEICHISDGEISRTMVRNTLKQVLESIPGETYLQCHRSFVVNPGRVESVEGNSQGLILKLANEKIEVPVSRKYIPVLKSALA